MATLCFGAAYKTYRGLLLPKFISASIFWLALMHLLKALALVAGSAFFPLLFIAVNVPTNTLFTDALPGFVTLFLLPFASIIILSTPAHEKVPDYGRP